MLNMFGQFMRLFTGFPGIGGGGGAGSSPLLVAKYQENEKQLNERLNYIDVDKVEPVKITDQDKQLIDEVSEQFDRARDQIEQALRV